MQIELEKTMATCLEQLDNEKKKVSKLEEEVKFKVNIIEMFNKFYLPLLLLSEFSVVAT